MYDASNFISSIRTKYIRSKEIPKSSHKRVERIVIKLQISDNINFINRTSKDIWFCLHIILKKDQIKENVTMDIEFSSAYWVERVTKIIFVVDIEKILFLYYNVIRGMYFKWIMWRGSFLLFLAKEPMLFCLFIWELRKVIRRNKKSST